MSEKQEPQRGANDVGALTHIVTRHAQLNADIKGMKFQQKELEESAWEKCGKTAKAIRQLSKESSWDAVKREKQRQLEEEIDQGRAALGMLAGTPLGQAELARAEAQAQQQIHEEQKYTGRAKRKKAGQAEAVN